MDIDYENLIMGTATHSKCNEIVLFKGGRARPATAIRFDQAMALVWVLRCLTDGWDRS